MSVVSHVRDAFLAAWLPRALRSMNKATVLRMIDLICRFNPGWRENVAPARELIQREHPFFQWAMAMRRDLHPRIFYKFVRTLIFQNFVADRHMKEFEAEHGAPPLASLLMSVTERCNMKCEGCWASEYDKRDDLPLPLMNRVVREYKEMRMSFVILTGGEPFLRDDIFDLMAAHPDAYFQIFTNGTLITEKVAETSPVCLRSIRAGMKPFRPLCPPIRRPS